MKSTVMHTGAMCGDEKMLSSLIDLVLVSTNVFKHWGARFVLNQKTLK